MMVEEQAAWEIDIRALPKVSLHDHLDGGLRASTIVELADEIGLELPVTDAEALEDWFIDASDSGSLTEYLETFAITTGVMQTREALVRVAREFVLDLADDGVVYGEIRWAPEQHLRGGLSLDGAVEAVQEGIDEATELVRASGRRMRIGQLLSAMRHADRAEEIARLALKHRVHGVVGFDIAGPEHGFLPSNHARAFDLLAREWMPVTVHAGEDDGLDSIADALIAGRALRLGHGVRIADDIEVADSRGAHLVHLGPLATWVKDRQIALEVAPTSNLQTGLIDHYGDDIEDHPFDLLYQLGFNVTVNTDNRLQSGTSLTFELAQLAEAFEYDLDDFEQFQLNAAQAAFLPVEERDDLADYISDTFEALQ